MLVSASLAASIFAYSALAAPINSDRFKSPSDADFDQSLSAIPGNVALAEVDLGKRATASLGLHASFPERPGVDATRRAVDQVMNVYAGQSKAPSREHVEEMVNKMYQTEAVENAAFDPSLYEHTENFESSAYKRSYSADESSDHDESHDFDPFHKRDGTVTTSEESIDENEWTDAIYKREFESDTSKEEIYNELDKRGIDNVEEESFPASNRLGVWQKRRVVPASSEEFDPFQKRDGSITTSEKALNEDGWSDAVDKRDVESVLYDELEKRGSINPEEVSVPASNRLGVWLKRPEAQESSAESDIIHRRDESITTGEDFRDEDESTDLIKKRDPNRLGVWLDRRTVPNPSEEVDHFATLAKMYGDINARDLTAEEAHELSAEKDWQLERRSPEEKFEADTMANEYPSWELDPSGGRFDKGHHVTRSVVDDVLETEDNSWHQGSADHTGIGGRPLERRSTFGHIKRPKSASVVAEPEIENDDISLLQRSIPLDIESEIENVPVRDNNLDVGDAYRWEA